MSTPPSIPSSSRISAVFKRLSSESRTALIPYITAGDPDLATSLAVMEALAEGGASIIELGVPFSDPMADGPAIEAAMVRALTANTTFTGVLDMVREFRSRHDTPLVLFGYLNPLFAYGLEAAARDAREAGADAFLVVDLPPEEAPQLTDHLGREGLDFIALFTPTSSDERIAAIAARASGFAYYVSMAGITGDALSDLEAVAGRVAEVRRGTGLPVAVGFGIRSEDDARAVARFADGVVIGTQLVSDLAAVGRERAAEVARDFARRFRAALDRR